MGGKAFAGKRVLLPEGRALGQRLLDELLAKGAIKRGLICGSIRRQCADVGDVDMVIEPSNDFALNAWLIDKFGYQSDKKTPAQAGLVDGIQVDILVTTAEGWGAACMHMTGSKQTNIRQRAVAQRRGLMLNEKGCWRNDELIAGATEQEVYEALGLTYLEPEDR